MKDFVNDAVGGKVKAKIENVALINHALWAHLHDTYGLILIESELDEIIEIAGRL